VGGVDAWFDDLDHVVAVIVLGHGSRDGVEVDHASAGFGQEPLGCLDFVVIEAFPSSWIEVIGDGLLRCRFPP
jgi:hypothetical protein